MFFDKITGGGRCLGLRPGLRQSAVPGPDLLRRRVEVQIRRRRQLHVVSNALHSRPNQQNKGQIRVAQRVRGPQFRPPVFPHRRRDPDEFGTRLAQDICQHSAAGVLLLVKAEHFPDIDGRLTPQGVLVLSKPMSTQLFTQSLRLLCGTRERLRGLEKKNATIEEKMEEIRLVNRAKWLLIGELNMTEQEAHRYIEKQAMDRCVTKRAIAEQILSTYK